jgi:hypothetical protein
MARLVVRRGFTIVELGVLVLVIGLALAVLVGIVLPAQRTKGCGGRHLKDSTQIRGIHQAMIVWAQNNRDLYPLPSIADAAGDTLDMPAEQKDTTANILSLLVYIGSIGTEMLYSPAEANGNIQVYETYEFERPTGTVNPATALWDPKLRADFTGPNPGHISYAHLLPHGPRLQKWNNSFNAEDVIVGNRGPQIAAVKYDAKGIAAPVFANNQSNTFLIHGGRATWEGNMAFNDNHVEFLTSVKAGKYTLADGSERVDVLFYDEPEDAAGLNHFLGIFTRAGAKSEDFRAIWD